jgi:hypothetical protein
MQSTRTTILLLGVLVGSIGIAQQYRCDWSVNGLGGGDMSSNAYRCGATAGQTVAGQLAGSQFLALIGFWQADYQVGIRENSVLPAPGRPVTRLESVAPNPFRSTTTIRYSLGTDAPAELDIYDGTGRLVRRWTVVRPASGTGSVSWNGRDAAGRELARGIYFCRLNADGETRTGRLVLVR